MANEFAFVDDELKRILDSYLSYVNSDGYEIALFKNNYTPVPGMVDADLTESDFPGYSRVGIGGAVWPSGVVDNVAIGTSPTTAVFTPSADDAQLAYGYAVYDAGVGNLSWAQLFPEPIEIVNGVPIVVTPRVKQRNCYD
jgi:hypothetical protein